MKRGELYRATTVIVMGVLVISLVWLGGCGGYISGGGSSSSPLTGTLVDTTTKAPVAGARVVLEQSDATGTDRVVASTTSTATGSFSFNPSASGTYDVVADATVTTTNAPTVTYAATVTFGVPANASLGQIPLVPEFGTATPTGIPATIVGRVSSAGTSMGFAVQVGVTLSALLSVSPPVGSINRITIPMFAGSTITGTTVSSLSTCASGTDCFPYSLLVPSGNFSFGTFSASGTQYTLVLQQPANVNYVVEGSAFANGAPLSPRCTPPTLSTPIVIVSGTPIFSSPNLDFTGCL